jgi:hypothetical protein
MIDSSSLAALVAVRLSLLISLFFFFFNDAVHAQNPVSSASLPVPTFFSSEFTLPSNIFLNETMVFEFSWPLESTMLVICQTSVTDGSSITPSNTWFALPMALNSEFKANLDAECRQI